MLRILIFSITTLLLMTIVFGQNYPLYNQCDSKWSNIGITTSSSPSSYHNNNITLCSSGSFLTSLATAMTHHSIKSIVNNQPSPIYTPIDIYNTITNDNNNILESLSLDINDIFMLPESSPSSFTTPMEKTIISIVEYLSNDMIYVHDETLSSLYNYPMVKSSSSSSTTSSPSNNQNGELSPLCNEINELTSFTLVLYTITLDNDHNISSSSSSSSQRQQQYHIGLAKQCTYNQVTIISSLIGDYITLDYNNIIKSYTFLLSYNYNERLYNQYISRNYNMSLLLPPTSPLTAVTPATSLGDSWVIPFPYPIGFLQCDPRWGSDMMINETLCQVGCLVHSVAVGLRNHGITINKQDVDPHIFNQFIRDNNGYTPTNSFIHTVVDLICTPDQKECHARWPENGKQDKITFQQLVSILKSGKHIAVANVRNGGHFVLAIGWNGSNTDQILVRDSAGGKIHREWYSLSKDIVGWRIYEMNGSIHY